ncbi:HAD-IIA family hydrolase [Metabacillus arenae]|uniref:Acid sugar phosphatase n=1 Tax=Metabacillus arenae TaxID=2771434 RepID=A0A926RZJ5_9BACI|nr:HAD-IIA family hydrolase [Metabacillus arenae]MBD1382865.1 HAD-IIA family hydrolase [Metabacillus arenae]
MMTTNASFLEEVDGFLIDLDGTIFKGDSLIPGADQAVAYIKSNQKQLVFVSNRGNYSRRMCCDKLKKLGIAAVEDEIILSSTVTARFLKKHYPASRVWPFGDPGLQEELETHGISIATVPEEADFLVITLHETLTYHDLNCAFQAVRAGARILATNTDKMFPAKSGLSIDVAGMIGAIEASTGRKTEMTFGKPSTFMAEAALERLEQLPERCLMIGDSVESDIFMGQMHSMKTMLVLSGNTKKEQLDIVLTRSKPNYIVESIHDLIQLN